MIRRFYDEEIHGEHFPSSVDEKFVVHVGWGTFAVNGDWWPHPTLNLTAQEQWDSNVKSGYRMNEKSNPAYRPQQNVLLNEPRNEYEAWLGLGERPSQYYPIMPAIFPPEPASFSPQFWKSVAVIVLVTALFIGLFVLGLMGYVQTVGEG